MIELKIRPYTPERQNKAQQIRQALTQEQKNLQTQAFGNSNPKYVDAVAKQVANRMMKNFIGLVRD
tara:strand:- start:35187 stop:35384 length:198 start_codon:yes stop_codon:yes gene_type:complete